MNNTEALPKGGREKKKKKRERVCMCVCVRERVCMCVGGVYVLVRLHRFFLGLVLPALPLSCIALMIFIYTLLCKQAPTFVLMIGLYCIQIIQR